MKRIGIIGGGFTGTMTAVHLIKKADGPCEIFIINERETFNKGIAFNPYSDKHLLNVITGKMSAFADRPDDFLDWVMALPHYAAQDRTLVANSFLPRKLFGIYVTEIWDRTFQEAAAKGIIVTVTDSVVSGLKLNNELVILTLENGGQLEVNYCVIATGNQVPRNPHIKNPEFYNSPNYFQNPWVEASVIGAPDDKPVLIIGNGLTMVDTVLSLLEHGFKGTIYSISPNGFNILPHRHGGMKYTALAEEITEGLSLRELVSLVNRHIRIVRDQGISAEPVIDSLRPFTQKIWQNLTAEEKKLFMARLRHLWGVARHRIPLNSHDKLQQLRIDGKLLIKSGRLLNFTENSDDITLDYFDKKTATQQQLQVGRVINCTGPESDLLKMDNCFLKDCAVNGLLSQDSLKLGINTDIETFGIIGNDGKPHSNLFTVGSNLRGELWESTAVNELRSQAEALAGKLVTRITEPVLQMEKSAVH